VRLRPLEVGDDLRHGKESHRDHREAYAVDELRDVERVARQPRVHVGADQTDQQAEHHHRQPFQRIALRQHRRAHEAHQHQREVLGGSEGERPFAERRPGEHDEQRADAAGKERSERGHGERGARASLPRHGIAVEAGDCGGGLARKVEQNRADGPSVLGAVVDAGEHDEGRHRRQIEGDREEQPDRGQRPDPGQDADQRAQGDAGEAIGQILRGEGDAEAER
jgi:hypothetical protein